MIHGDTLFFRAVDCPLPPHTPMRMHRSASFRARTATLYSWLVGLVLCTLTVTASAEEGLASLRSAGMGDNMVAGAAGTAALFHNPAGLSAIHLYSMEVGYNHSMSSKTHHLGIAAADSATNPGVAGGFAYTFSFSNGEDRGKYDDARDHNIRIATALPVIQERLILGVTGQYLNYNRGRESALPDAAKQRYNGFTLDVGLMARLGDRFFLGVVAQDLLLVHGARDYRTLRAGAGAVFGVIRLQGEYGVKLDGPRSQHHGGAGLELMLKGIAARGGFRHVTAGGPGTRHENLLSFGAGYRGQRFGVDFAYRQQLQRAPDRFVGVSLSFFMQ